MKKNAELINEVNKLVSKLDMTPFIKERLKLVLMRYEYSRQNKWNSYDYSLEEINNEKLNSHLVGLIDGDGSIKTGKRTGYKKGLYRIVPNIVIELMSSDGIYLKLINK